MTIHLRLIDKRTLLWQGLESLCQSRFVPSSLGAVLLVAAVLKGYELGNQELSETTWFSSRGLLVSLVVFELALGLWLLSGMYAQEASWVSLITFVVFFQAALYMALTDEPSCRCMGLITVPPWMAAAFDVVCIMGIILWQPSARRVTIYTHPQRAIAIGVVFVATAVAALTTMIDYAPTGMVPSLRKDARLAPRVTIEKSNPTVSEILAELRKATGLDFSVDPRLRDPSPDNVGEIKVRRAPAWSLMEYLAQRHTTPARWKEVEGGYKLVAGAPFGRLAPWVFVCVLLSVVAGWLVLNPPFASGR